LRNLYVLDVDDHARVDRLAAFDPRHDADQRILEDLAHEDTSLALGVRIRGRTVLADSLASSLIA
jgi:hypothetical protein